MHSREHIGQATLFDLPFLPRVTASAKNGANLKAADRIAGIKRLLLLGWTQQAVADAVGVTQQAITRSCNSLRLRGELPPEPTNREGKGRTGKVVQALPVAITARGPSVRSCVLDSYKAEQTGATPTATMPMSSPARRQAA